MKPGSCLAWKSWLASKRERRGFQAQVPTEVATVGGRGAERGLSVSRPGSVSAVGEPQSSPSSLLPWTPLPGRPQVEFAPRRVAAHPPSALLSFYVWTDVEWFELLRGETLSRVEACKIQFAERTARDRLSREVAVLSETHGAGFRWKLPSTLPRVYQERSSVDACSLFATRSGSLERGRRS